MEVARVAGANTDSPKGLVILPTMIRAVGPLATAERTKHVFVIERGTMVVGTQIHVYV